MIMRKVIIRRPVGRHHDEHQWWKKEFSLELSDDVETMRDWTHDFGVEYIRPVAHEWDEREETPWPNCLLARPPCK